MKKVIILSFLLALIAGETLAQLSTRDNLAFNQPLGTRPEAGDAALTFVVPFTSLVENNGEDAGLYTGNFLAGGDFLTFKYYNTSDMVWRAAIRLVANNGVTNGTVADSSAVNDVTDADVSLWERKSVSREWSLAGGVEKHFTNNNVFDVYVGGEALIGLGKDKTSALTEYFSGDSEEMVAATGTTIFGLGGVVGVNVFVAELPVSVGLEYGLTGKWIFGGKTKITASRDLDGSSGDYDEEWIEQDVDAFGDADDRKYSDLSRRQFNMNTNHNVRIVINIYFSTDSGE